MKKTAEQPPRSKKLILHKETLRLLTQAELRRIEGGDFIPREPNIPSWLLPPCDDLSPARDVP